MIAAFRWFICLLIVVPFFGGCASSTRIEKNESATIREYGDLYFVAMTKDPRNVEPKAIAEFKSMGFKVKVIDPKKPIEGAQGTGFVISPEGHVLTCAHLLGDEKVATFWLSGVRYEADVVSIERKKDLAVLKPKAPLMSGVPVLSFRNDKIYSIGADVSTIGFPLGNLLGNSIRYTKGSISATSGLNNDPEQLQVSAQVQPGSSGGPLFDKDGRVIGVIQKTLNPLKLLEQTGGALPQNVNFAIKSDVVLDYLQSGDKALYQSLVFNKGYSIDELQKSVARVRAGIISDEWEKKPKLFARVDYVSIWDLWYRFRFFVVRVFDFDSQELLFAAGQGRDNKLSSEDKVIKDTFAEVRKALHKN